MKRFGRERKVKCSLFDNVMEYELSKFEEFCTMNIICMENTVKGISQYNNMAKYMNGCSMNMLGMGDSILVLTKMF